MTYQVERNSAGVVTVYSKHTNYREALAAMIALGGAPYYVKKYPS